MVYSIHRWVNYHLSRTFFIWRERTCNILVSSIQVPAQLHNAHVRTGKDMECCRSTIPTDFGGLSFILCGSSACLCRPAHILDREVTASCELPQAHSALPPAHPRLTVCLTYGNRRHWTYVGGRSVGSDAIRRSLRCGGRDGVANDQRSLFTSFTAQGERPLGRYRLLLRL